jgi:threonine/homoserine/homoserine lactone efflux protein
MGHYQNPTESRRYGVKSILGRRYSDIAYTWPVALVSVRAKEINGNQTAIVMIEFLGSGTILGLSAGFAPGPLLALVISETLRHDMKAGIKVALAPVLTDLPIILLTLFLLTKISGFQIVLGGISIMGAVFVFYMGFESVRTKGVNIGNEGCSPMSLKKGVLVNFLSPHPYLFWFSVGAPITMKAMDQGFLAVCAFVGGFYAMLVGAKMTLALLTAKSRTFLTGKIYLYTMRCLGLILIGFALFLFMDGLKLAGLF